MAKEIVAYMSEDGVIHLDKEEADYADFSAGVKTDVASFLRQQNHSDVDGNVARLIIKWEMWKVGGFAGWKSAQPAPTAVPMVEEVCIVDVGKITHKPTKVSEPPKVEPYKKHVAVVGLFPGVQPGVKKEFGDLFKLALYSADETSKLHGVKAFHKVFLMTRFTSHKHLETLRALGQEPMLIRGGVNELKDAMAAYHAAS